MRSATYSDPAVTRVTCTDTTKLGDGTASGSTAAHSLGRPEYLENLARLVGVDSRLLVMFLHHFAYRP